MGNQTTPLYDDTQPEMEALQIELIRAMPPWKKMTIIDGLNSTVRTLAVNGIKQRHPDATPQEVRRMLADLMLGEELAQKVYGSG